jgi:hypothetical protein
VQTGAKYPDLFIFVEYILQYVLLDFGVLDQAEYVFLVEALGLVRTRNFTFF